MDWWDIVSKEKPKRHPYLIQWDMESGKVRAKHNDEHVWRTNGSCVKAEHALMLGYKLLQEEKVCET
jgi:hypothetical protein